MQQHPLDDPIRSALTGRHSPMAITSGTAARYPGDVAPFGSMPLSPTPADWASLAEIATDDAVAMFVPTEFVVADGWSTHLELGLVQLTDDDVDTSGTRGDDIVDLADADVPEMLRLTALTRPGPFLPRTIAFGGYVGVVDGGRLVAMAGRRLSMPGWVEISAVCTDPEARGRGLARRLITEVARGVRADGDRAFLHVAAGNPAQGLYEAMGFVVRRTSKVVDVTPPR
ncbi:FR47-like protein [Frondihabitans sp. PhB188]|uniref:GNAT family N-acetyltransferase n=1 Tax=Frondihabitans sp. PhB188 TaxID=2485200 RepID=UPI000F462FDE|nr:GNAT family N-acetyltransferase [Frondihabitans sp. PhB188]ROQ41593.1 FR47-like protein [Frondihabitans sp. PhB188]